MPITPDDIHPDHDALDECEACEIQYFGIYNEDDLIELDDVKYCPSCIEMVAAKCAGRGDWTLNEHLTEYCLEGYCPECLKTIQAEDEIEAGREIA